MTNSIAALCKAVLRTKAFWVKAEGQNVISLVVCVEDNRGQKAVVHWATILKPKGGKCFLTGRHRTANLIDLNVNVPGIHGQSDQCTWQSGVTEEGNFCQESCKHWNFYKNFEWPFDDACSWWYLLSGSIWYHKIRKVVTACIDLALEVKLRLNFVVF